MSVNKPILEAFNFALGCFPPVLCEVHREPWGRLSLFCSPDPLWFVLWEPERVEYVWESTGYKVQVIWVPGSRAQVLFTEQSLGPVSPNFLKNRLHFGVEISTRAVEAEKQLRRQLTSIPPGEAKRAIRSLDEVLTETYERRTNTYAVDRTGRSRPAHPETP